MKILIGSQAMVHHGISMKKPPKDTDYFTTTREERNVIHDPSMGIEAFYHASLREYGWESGVASIDELYTIKVSHSYWMLKNGSWDKHIYHMILLKNQGAKLVPELHDLLYKVWSEIHGPKRANLEQSPEDFFNANVQRTYEHDSIHASVAYYDEPLFNKILRDNHEVAVDKSKFDALSLEEKLQLVREEVYATALERQIIPSNYDFNNMKAYIWALKKTITSFTKGWFPLFILENFKELSRPDVEYVKIHLDNKDKLVLL